MKIRRNSAYRKKTGKQWNVNELFNLEDACKQKLGLFPRYYLHMTHLNKVGFNYAQSYTTTPFGVYAYPLDEMYLHSFYTMQLPYLATGSHFFILELLEPEKCLALSDVHGGTQVLRDIYTYLRNGSGDMRVFRSKLTHLGITSVLSYNGEIYAAEPQQIVFLSPTAYKVVFSGYSMDAQASEDTLENQIKVRMSKKAAMLGFTWPRKLGPSPVWALSINDIQDNDLFVIATHFWGVPIDNPAVQSLDKIWRREVTLWKADCLERVLPVYENWAREHAPKLITAGRGIITRLTKSANDSMDSYMELDSYLLKFSNRPAIQNMQDYSSPAYHAIQAFATLDVQEAARATSRPSFETQIQRTLFAERIDKKAPWSMGLK